MKGQNGGGSLNYKRNISPKTSYICKKVHSRHLFYFRLLNSDSKFFAKDWIRTADLWYRKIPHLIWQQQVSSIKQYIFSKP